MNYVIPSGLTVVHYPDDELWSVGVPHSNGEHYEDTLCQCFDEAVANALVLFPEFIMFVENFVFGFEQNHVLGNGKVVDNPPEVYYRRYKEAKALLERFDEFELGVGRV